MAKPLLQSRTFLLSGGVAASQLWPIAEHLLGGGQWEPEFTGTAVQAIATMMAYTYLRLNTSEAAYTPPGWPGPNRPNPLPPDTYPAPYDSGPRYDDRGNYRE